MLYLSYYFQPEVNTRMYLRRAITLQADSCHNLNPQQMICISSKGGQVTKPIILVKICYKLLDVIQGVENSFGKVTSWPQLISEFLVGLAPQVFC